MSVSYNTLLLSVGRAISEENLLNNSLYELNGKVLVDKDLISSARGLLQNSGQTPLPTVVQLSSEELNNHWAAFSSDTNTIYVAPDLNSFPELENAVLVHELGHWLANQLGLQSTHASVRNFTNTSVGELQESSQNLGNTNDADLSSNQTITLPDGRIIKAQYFDTIMHTDWDKQLFPLLSQKASTIITNAQNDTDAFTTWDPLYTQAISYSAYGLQTHSPSHFDNNNISGGLSAIRSRWIDGINRFNDIEIKAASSIRERIDYTDYLVNPAFSGSNAGIELLLYRFGQIAHSFEDFYAHSNWVELAKNGLLAPKGTNLILDAGLDWPAQIKPGDFIAGTNVMVAQSGPDWRKMLKKSGTGSYSGSLVDVYWNVDSTDPDDKNNSKVAVVSATTLDGRIVYGLASGATSGAIYMDKDNSVFLRDPAKTAWYQQEYFRGFDHGGIAGTLSGKTLTGQWVSPLNKDKEKQPNHQLAKQYANRQTQNEWDRMGNLIYKYYGVTGLNKFANYVYDSQVARDAYVGTYSKPAGRTSNPSVALENPKIGANSLSTNVQLDSFTPTSNNKTSNWLSRIDSNFYVTDIGITTTHNSMAYTAHYDFDFKRKENYEPEFTFLNQEGANLEQQFAGGIRKFSLKTGMDSVAGRTDFWFAHAGNRVGDGSDEAFRQLFNSLANNPSEFVIFNIDPYENAVWEKNNPNIDFWDTEPAKRIHSFFFQDGRKLQGTPRVWDESVFKQWGINLPEEKKQLLRGKSLFYVPEFGYDNPTIPKIKDLRGKFILGDESWTNGNVYTNQQLQNLSKDYAKDFPDGIYYNRDKYRLDNYGRYYFYDNRAANRDFVDGLQSKPKHMPSFLGLYNSNGANILTGIFSGHANIIWNESYWGDGYTPSFKDVLLYGKETKSPLNGKVPPNGTITGEFFTDFGVRRRYDGSNINDASVAELIISKQKQVGLFTSILGSSTSEALNSSLLAGDAGSSLSEGQKIQLKIKDSSDQINSDDYYIVVDGLSATFDQSDVHVEGGSLLSGPLLPESTRNLLSARAFIIDPKSDLEITLHLLDNDTKTEHFTTQLLHKISGELYGAPETYELLPTASVNDPLIRLVKLFGSDYFNASSPFNSGKYSYQYFDPTLRNWLDTDYIAFDMHSDIDSLVSSQIATPAKNQHGMKGERAVWRINSDTTIDRSGTNYFVELANNKTTVYIDDFDIHHDRIFLVDDSSNEIPLPKDLYAPTSASKLVDKLVNYNVALNFRPETFSRPNLFHVSSEQLASSLSLNANQFASDYLGKQLFFTAFDNSLPFLELKNGKLVATSIDAKYIGGTHTVYTSISNGTSILTNVPIHIALAPKLNINGDLFDNQSVFNLTITKLSDSSYTIYVQLEDVSNQGIGSFVEVASTTGSASGLATGFDSLNSKVFLGDEINSGKVKFWLKGTTDQLVPLTIVSNNTGSYRMLNQIGDEIAKFNYQGLNITPHGSSLVYGDSFYDGLGFDLNQSMNDIALKALTDPWRVTISMDLYREAVINNQIGLYLFDKSSNGILDPVSGMVIDHDLDFAKNIERYAVWTGSTDNGIAKQFSAEFNINSLVDIDTVAIAPFLKIPNNLSSNIYSSFDSLNSQGACVAKMLSDNVIGFDDIHDGTQDLDYDDLIIRFNTLRVV